MTDALLSEGISILIHISMKAEGFVMVISKWTDL